MSTGQPDRQEAFTVALTDSVDLAHAPIPSNDSEQLLFRQLFPRLVWVDCEGSVHPDLPFAWQADPARRTWAFTLADSSHPASLSDAAARIVSNWQLRQDEIRDLGVLSASVGADGRLMVSMRDPLDSVPRIFADPAFAITREIQDTGPLKFRAQPHSDPRDLLDGDADLLVTRDPALVEYAGSKSGFTASPLPWSRTYIMLEPAASAPLPRSVGGDAVRADARAAEPPFWWEVRPMVCDDSTALPSSAASTRVVYPRGDRIGQGLAERIVALTGSSAELRATALDPAEFDRALASGAERAYILAVPRQSIAPCRDSAGWPRGARLQALIDTRAYAIVRRGSASLRIEWDGTPKLMDEWKVW